MNSPLASKFDSPRFRLPTSAVLSQSLLAICLMGNLSPVAAAVPDRPVSQRPAGYIIETMGTNERFPTADLACKSLPDFNQPGMEQSGTYTYIGAEWYTTLHGKEMWGCNYMVIAKPGSGLADQGPLRMAAASPQFDTGCDLGYKFIGKCVYTGEKNEGKTCPATNEPINIATGNKFLSPVIFRGTGAFPITVSLHYNSTNPSSTVKGLPGGFEIIPGSQPSWRNTNYDLACFPKAPVPGEANDPDYVPPCLPPGTTAIRTWTAAPGKGWLHNGQKAVNELPGGVTAALVREDGKAFLFNLAGGVWKSDADVNGKLERIVSSTGKTRGWKYTNLDMEIESYDLLGRLESVQDKNGLKHSYLRDADGMVTSIRDSFNREVTLTYDSIGRLKTVTDPVANVYTLAFDSRDNLASIRLNDEPPKTYLYENPAFPHALTGIVDENGKREITYVYDGSGRAYLEYKPGDVDKTTLSFSADGLKTTVTDAFNTSRTLTFAKLHGVNKLVGSDQPGGAGCAAAASSVSYDANGNVAQKVGFKGEITKYIHDLTRNLETSRTEAFGTPEQRTITTVWHPEFPLPVRIMEPKRRTDFSYDAVGNQLTRSVYATSDATGAQGLSAATVGPARTWTMTYNAQGQIKSVDGPRTDVADTTTYDYDAAGNLEFVTEALGHKAHLSDYDALGRPRRMQSPGGITTDLTYTARGAIKTVRVSAGGVVRTTTYHHDHTGKVTSIDLPAGVTMSYGYDDANRLIRIADNLGNSIDYTLDAMGNRKAEETRDPSGTLARHVTREYDALNRLQKQTGAAQ